MVGSSRSLSGESAGEPLPASFLRVSALPRVSDSRQHDRETMRLTV